jgi:hypothetical protein
MDIEVIDVIQTPVLLDSNLELPNINETEKNISLVAGSFIIWKSVKNIFRHPTLAIYGLALGGFLVYRGKTGICPLYKKLEIDTTNDMIPLTDLV